MVRNYNKIKQGRAGFTIVELLIVIVVIGILAAITIVSYSGITARANTAKAQTNAANTQKVAEAYNADNNGYPATSALLTSYSGSAKLPTGITLQATAPTSANGTTTLLYVPNTASTGGCIGYWNFSTSAVVPVYVGSAASLTISGTTITCT
jgi:prepilin-type N-terminal cleavage/methylation domain-containing protein